MKRVSQVTQSSQKKRAGKKKEKKKEKSELVVTVDVDEEKLDRWCHALYSCHTHVTPLLRTAAMVYHNLKGELVVHTVDHAAHHHEQR